MLTAYFIPWRAGADGIVSGLKLAFRGGSGMVKLTLSCDLGGLARAAILAASQVSAQTRPAPESLHFEVLSAVIGRSG